MNIVTNRPYTVFKNEYNGYIFYKLGLSKKDKTGVWVMDILTVNLIKIYF